MESIREQLQIFTRRFGLLNESCCDECCGQQVTMTQSHILFEVRRSGSPSMQQVAEGHHVQPPGQGAGGQGAPLPLRLSR